MPITLEEYENLTSEEQNVKIHFFNQTSRTLLYGYTCSRNTFHVYLDEEGCVIKYIYGYKDVPIRHEKYEVLTNDDLYKLVPDKRVYPESTDYEFLQILLKNQVYVPFTTYDSERYTRVKNEQYHGKLFYD